MTEVTQAPPPSAPSVDIATPNLAAQSAALSEATKIEQARAIAEVQAAVIVARQCPRSIPDAIAAMQYATDQPSLAARAFFKFPRAGESITGPSIHLARELARVWGNIDYGIKELRRDDAAGHSEMLAYAWDVQTNARNSHVFIVPHARDTKARGRMPLTDLRDVYENNANQGARRVREAIFAVLPTWYTEPAKQRCHDTLARGNGQPVEVQAREAIAAFSDMGVTEAQLAAKVGRPVDRWTGEDLAGLHVTFTSLRRGEVTLSEEFPDREVADGVTVQEIRDQAAQPVQETATATATAKKRTTKKAAAEAPLPSPSAAPPEVGEGDAAPSPSPTTPPEERPARAEPAALQAIRMRFNVLGLIGEANRERRISIVDQILGHEVVSMGLLTAQEAADILEYLGHFQDAGALEDSFSEPEATS